MLQEIPNRDLRERINAVWKCVDSKIYQKNWKPRVKRAKKAWARKRLVYVLGKILVNKRYSQMINTTEKENLFTYIGDYAISEAFRSKQATFDMLIELIHTKGLQKCFINAYFSEELKEDRLFKSIAEVLYS